MKAAFISVVLSLQSFRCQGQSYSDMLVLEKAKLNRSIYSRNIRPLLDQNSTIIVEVGFAPVSIVDINDVSQSFMCNGFVSLEWHDEIIRWNPEEYGNVTQLNPEIKSIWNPRLILINTLQERDPLKDDFSPLFVDYGGAVSWYPGGLLSTSCDLDMTKYPFDEQTCTIAFQAMGYCNNLLSFRSNTSKMDLTFMTQNSEWILINHFVSAGVPRDFWKSSLESYANFTFTVRRRPTTFMYSIMLPIVIISFLNILGFAISVESGEKISYGITVMLAQAVFMTVLKNMLPTSSRTVPYVTIYVFSLLLIAAFTVIISILVVYLHHKEKRPKTDLKDQGNHKWRLSVMGLNKGPGTPTFFDRLSSTDIDPVPCDTDSAAFSKKSDGDYTVREIHGTIRWQTISRWVNAVSFALSFIAWIVSTVVFAISVSS